MITMMTSSSPLQADDSSSSSNSALTTLRGVLFRCTIRGGHATLAIIPSSDGDANEDDSSIVMIVVQMGGGQWNNKESTAGSSGEQFASRTAKNLLQLCHKECEPFTAHSAFSFQFCIPS